MSADRGSGRGGGRGAGRGGSGFRGSPRGQSPSPGQGGSPGRGRGSGFRGGGPPPRFGGATIDARVTSTNVNDLTSKLASLRTGTSSSTVLPPRPAFGSAGRAIVVRANHFPIAKFTAKLYEYSVQITPATKVAGVKRRLFDLLNNAPAFTKLAKHTANDRSSKVISSKELPLPPGGTLDIPVVFYDEDESGPPANATTYTLALSFTTVHDTSVLRKFLNADPTLRDHEIGPVITAFQIILGKHAVLNGAVRMGKGEGAGSKTRYFFPTTDKARLDDFLIAWKGFSVSVRPTWQQLSLNVNVATTAFYEEGPLAQALEKLASTRRQSQANLFFSGVKVKFTHIPRKKKIARITSQKPAEFKFSFQRDATTPARTISVAQYFKEQYNYTVRNPNLPLIEFGTRAKPSYIPAELCIILPGQPFRGKLTGDQTRKMLDVAVLNPGSHQARILEAGVPSLGLSPVSETLKEFGVEVGTQLVTLPARQLPGQSVEYRGKKKLTVNDGAWNLVGSKFYQGAVMGKIPVLLLSDGTNYTGAADVELKAALQAFAGVCDKYGLNTQGLEWVPTLVQLAPPHIDPKREKAMAEINSKLTSMPIRPKPSIMLVIMSREDKVYELLKRDLGLRHDMHSVCSLYNKFNDRKDQYFANLALKFNTKLGGINHVVTGTIIDALKTQGTMLVGADVTHPGPSSIQGTPSIAGVVATNDNTFSRFPVSLRLQHSGTEMIAELEEMMIERLKAYQERNRNELPKNIVFVRDGVSEGQFPTVAEVELPQIREACRRVSPSKPYKPKITLLVAGKRHQTRFYATSEDDADQRNGFNTRAGTVVEHGVTSVYLYDFFLQSHAALKGTARPTHYTFIIDEKGFSPDETQSLLHSISIVARATRSVGLASPAYYADLACEHARHYIQDLYIPDSASTVSQDREEQAAQMLARARTMWGRGPTGDNFKNSMFYL